jgi:hypothetical protein
MAIDVQKRRWRSAEVSETAGITRRQLRQWREEFGLFPWAAAGKEGNRFSVVDTCLVVAVATVRDAGFNVGSAIDWMQANLPVWFERVAGLRLNFGCWCGITIPMFQPAAACAITATLDLDRVVERVIAGLRLPTPIFDAPPSKLQTAFAVVERADKFINSPHFAARCAAFLKIVTARRPPATTLAEISVSLGVPLWILAMEDETHRAWPVAKRLRSEMEGVALE